jgi:hypothetical protein
MHIMSLDIHQFECISNISLMEASSFAGIFRRLVCWLAPRCSSSPAKRISVNFLLAPFLCGV